MAIIKKSVVLHPLIERFVRETQALLIRAEPPVDATYSAALNFLLLSGIHEALKPGGLTQETRDTIWDFVRDRETIEELNLHDRLSAVQEAFARLEPPPTPGQAATSSS
jgi:hypothetical protein